MPRAIADPIEDPSTASHLLDVAERLFAERGIASVSIRQIVLTGGQGNLSAAHYHFGSRDALIRALVERRLRTLDALRHARLDRLVEDGRQGELGAIVGAAIGTLADAVESAPWGADYVRVLAQALFDTRMKLLDTVDPELLGSVARARTMARPLVPHLSDSAFAERVTIVHHESAYALARWIARHGRVDAGNRRAYRAMIRDTVSFMAAGLAAPVLRLPSPPRPKGSP
jgi:AcrR family transcriptional regulator